MTTQYASNQIWQNNETGYIDQQNVMGSTVVTWNGAFNGATGTLNYLLEYLPSGQQVSHLYFGAPDVTVGVTGATASNLVGGLPSLLIPTNRIVEPIIAINGASAANVTLGSLTIGTDGSVLCKLVPNIGWTGPAFGFFDKCITSINSTNL